MPGPYLTKAQIRSLVKRIGQPRASVLLNGLFNSYRHLLDSSDVAALYDREYRERIGGHEVHELVDGKYEINVFNRHTFDYLRARLAPSSRVVDVGCGTGQFALAVAASGAESVLGLDFDGEAIAAARALASDSGLNCRFISGDVSGLPTGERYDFVVLNDVTEHLSDRELRSLLTKIHGILEDGGEMIVHTPNGLALCNGTDADLFVRAHLLYLRLRRRWRGFERTVDQLYYDQVHINIKSYRQLKRLLLECGFTSRVIYDDAHLPRWKRRLSSNMLVIARKAGA